ncbi:hypothetical protein [Allobacillus halotolerans]|uniref:Uncharacterized protein n=1 Tax=Allobacillus halotolerans TaxID=570278 RepID=A0ABS6GS86_9BACI|nr:hypothetical protein [Allobacillus halotolerans]MBU6081485.1 hypothetical protein [Allobacillus halotolerans]
MFFCSVGRAREARAFVERLEPFVERLHCLVERLESFVERLHCLVERLHAVCRAVGAVY